MGFLFGLKWGKVADRTPRSEEWMESYEDIDLGEGHKAKRRNQLNQQKSGQAPEEKPRDEPTFESPPPQVLPCHNS